MSEDVKYQSAWMYYANHIGQHLIAVALWLATLQANGGHLPTDFEGWVFFGSALIASVWGGANTITGAKTLTK